MLGANTSISRVKYYRFSFSLFSYADKKAGHWPNIRFSLHYNSYNSHLQGRCSVVLCLSRLVCEYYVAYVHISVITFCIRLGAQYHLTLKHCYFHVHARQRSACLKLTRLRFVNCVQSLCTLDQNLGRNIQRYLIMTR